MHLYPNWDLPEDLSDALEARFDQVEEETGWSYWSHRSVAPGSKVGGPDLDPGPGSSARPA
ncbi:hypothetical protein ABZW30_01595 [Kitasatospora sp. NPDC004669]|uniref:hypothetical protein n=1 Tax=Kitasatospora sp. NPDC004669 TaxID=3154555 RepID=UPI0033B3EA2E